MKDIQLFFERELVDIYYVDERRQLFRMAAGEINGFSMLHLHFHPEDRVSESELLKYSQWVKRLKNHEPVQYITGKAWFMGLEIQVDSSVLIPRPETEEIVNFVLEQGNRKQSVFLDACTGSGCIALALKHYLPEARVFALELSEQALETARKNAQLLSLEIDFIEADVFRPLHLPHELGIDLLISNPPYIPEKERESLAKHVHEREPSMALFVPNEDPLIFYRRLGELLFQHGNPGAELIAECHTSFAQDVLDLWTSMGLSNLHLHQDLSGLDRFVTANLAK